MQHLLETDTHAQWLQKNCPSRLPGPKDYRTATRTAQRRSRLDKSPLVAIEILAASHPEAFLAYVTSLIEPPRVRLTSVRSRYPRLLGDNPEAKITAATRFEVVIGTPYSLLTALIQTLRMGLYMDSSWRNKNAFRCPLTMLVTINEFHRMIPGE